MKPLIYDFRSYAREFCPKLSEYRDVDELYYGLVHQGWKFKGKPIQDWKRLLDSLEGKMKPKP